MKKVKLSLSISRKGYRYPLCGLLGGPQSHSRRFWKRENLLLLPDFEGLTFQPVANRYTDCTIAVLRGLYSVSYHLFLLPLLAYLMLLETIILSPEYPFVGNYRRNNFHINTLRTGLLNCLNARSRGLTFRHRASCI